MYKINNMKKIVFIGGIGAPDVFGGELTKNKNILSKLFELNYNINIIDTYKSSSSMCKLISIFMRIMVYFIFTRRTIMFSTSLGNIYPLLKILYLFPKKRKLIYWGIGGQFPDKVKNGIFKTKYLLLFNKILVEGEKMKKTLSECGIMSVDVVPNFKKISELPKIDKLNDGKVHFIFISRIRPEKGVSYILDVAGKLNEKGYRDKYVIDFYGDIEHSYESVFTERVNDIDNVQYRNTIDLSNWDNYKSIAKYHYMLFPTYWKGEGFPGVIIDAYIAGVPVIASNWSLNSEYVVNNITGIIIPSHNGDELYDTIVDVIKGKYNLHNMSLKCQENALKYNTENVLSEKFINRLI